MKGKKLPAARMEDGRILSDREEDEEEEEEGEEAAEAAEQRRKVSHPGWTSGLAGAGSYELGWMRLGWEGRRH